MELNRIIPGVWWLDIPEVDLHVLCGAPADVVKHLMLQGYMVTKNRGGVEFETGPNAILLSDVSIQNGQFANLAEFPILQMLYRQGMLIPGHPNNTGRKPLLIGHPAQISAQSEYIRRGNYGLTSVEEIVATGIPRETAEEMFRIKLKFAFGRIRSTEELIDFCPIEATPVEVAPSVQCKRKGLNVYEFTHADQTVSVDLNLKEGEEYAPAVSLDFHRINREYFSITYIGEGDGWDTKRPCMASLLTFQGKIYLIDTGPNILSSLTALGISVNEIEGIFHTHCHDDHFAGLTSLVRADHRIAYYATPMVRASVSKKLAALMGISEQRFLNSFDIHDLKFDEWNNVGGLQVLPVYSPHPVETSNFIFRSYWENGWKTYSHLADIPSRKVVDDLMSRKEGLSPAAKKLYETFLKWMNEGVDRKKIDIGGGMIHGQASDFVGDTSTRILLSHVARPLTPAEKEIGSDASFGQEDVLIPATIDYPMLAASEFLHSYFPDVAEHDLNMLLNCPVVAYHVGEILIKKGQEIRHVFVVLTGVAESIDAQRGMTHRLSAGSLIGDSFTQNKNVSPSTYRTVSPVKTLRIPIEIYREFLVRNLDQTDHENLMTKMAFLQDTSLFGEMVSSLIQLKLSRQIRDMTIDKGSEIPLGDEPQLILLKSGEAEVLADVHKMEVLKPGDFFGEESLLLGSSAVFHAKTLKSCEIYILPGKALKGIPIVEWKIMEAYERRLQAFGTLF